MNSPLLVRAGAFLFASLLFLSAAQAAEANTFVGGTNVWMMIGAPSFIATGINPLGAD